MQNGSGIYKKGQLLCLSFKNNNPEPCGKDMAVAVLILAMRRLLHRKGVPFPCQRQGQTHLNRFVLESVGPTIVNFLRGLVWGLRPDTAAVRWRPAVVAPVAGAAAVVG
jgi:hypothetical protein